MRRSATHAAAGEADSADRRRRRVVVLLLLGALVVGLLAYWLGRPGPTLPSAQPTPSWTGQGAAAVEGQGGESLAVNQTARVAGLAPGRPAQELYGTFDNLTGYTVLVQSVTATVESLDREGCTPADFVITGSPSKVAVTVPPGEGRGSWSGISIRLQNRPVNQDACKGARVTIRYTAE